MGVLNLMDVCTRLSAPTIIPSKNRDTVIKAIFEHELLCRANQTKY